MITKLNITLGIWPFEFVDFGSMSTSMRLTVAVVVTALIVCLAISLLARRSKSRQNEAEPVTTDKPAVDNTGTEASFAQTDEWLMPELTSNLDRIVQLSELMSKTTPSDDARLKSRSILEAASESKQLIQNIELVRNSSSKSLEYNPLTLNFEELVQSIQQKWAAKMKGSGVVLTCHLDENIPTCLFFDPSLLIRILDSLLSNSIKMTEKGRVHVHITGHNPADFDWTVSMIVADTGRGFNTMFGKRLSIDESPAELSNAAEVNVLAARALCRKMGGSLKFKSVQNRGTEIVVTFPTRAAMVMAQDDTSTGDSSLIASSGSLFGKRVLVIEDDLSSQEVLRTFLEPEGCEIDCIDDGDQAMETLQAKRYDLVLMDVRMAGLDGIKTTQAIRKSNTRFKNIPIIAITADTSPDTNANCMMAGVDLFLTKPVSAKGLFDGIRFVMDLGAEIRAPIPA